MRPPSVAIANQLLQFADIQSLFFPLLHIFVSRRFWILAIWDVFLTVIWFICKWGFIWLFSFDKIVKAILSASWCSYLHWLKAISKPDLAIQRSSVRPRSSRAPGRSLVIGSKILQDGFFLYHPNMSHQNPLWIEFLLIKQNIQGKNEGK